MGYMYNTYSSGGCGTSQSMGKDKGGFCKVYSDIVFDACDPQLCHYRHDNLGDPHPALAQEMVFLSVEVEGQDLVHGDGLSLPHTRPTIPPQQTV